MPEFIKIDQLTTTAINKDDAATIAHGAHATDPIVRAGESNWVPFIVSMP